MSENIFITCKKCGSDSSFYYGYKGKLRRYCLKCGYKEEKINKKWDELKEYFDKWNIGVMNE